MENKDLPGYDYGRPGIQRSPVTLEELDLLKRTVTLTDEDMHYLRMAGDVLESRTGDVVDAWRAVIGANPHLARYYYGPDGAPDAQYKAAVGERFKQWILDICRRPLDQAWLDYQHEIGMRHTHAKKNQTDGVAAPPHIALRYMLAFTAPINDAILPFLAKDGHSAEEVSRMHRAWCKMVILQVTLWARPYVPEADW